MISNFIFAHLSWKLKWGFLIPCRPFVRPSVCLLFTFIFTKFINILLQNHQASLVEGNSIFFLQNHWRNFNQIQVCSNKWPRPFPKEIAKPERGFAMKLIPCCSIFAENVAKSTQSDHSKCYFYVLDTRNEMYMIWITHSFINCVTSNYKDR